MDRERFKYRSRLGCCVRSQSEAVIADTLDDLGLSFRYETRLFVLGEPGEWHVPDFTIYVGEYAFYWEHLHLQADWLHEAHLTKSAAWYVANSLESRLVLSMSSDVELLTPGRAEQIARYRLLGQEEYEGSAALGVHAHREWQDEVLERARRGDYKCDDSVPF